MSTSYIEYKKKGFWVNDSILIEFAQKFLQKKLPDWFPEYIKKYYYGLSTDSVGSGCITLWLDDLLENNQKKDWYIQQVKIFSSENEISKELKKSLLSLIAK